MTLLDIRDLSISFAMYDRWLRQTTQPVIQSLSLSLEAGEIVAVVGASGSGKSLLAHAILGLLPQNASVAGEILFEGKPLTAAALSKLRGSKIALIPQSVQYLDPLMTVGKQVEQAARIGEPKALRQSIFRSFRLPEGAAKLYPFQLSGGMARRVLVSTAAVSGARLIIADEPTPGLDEAVIQETLRIFQDLSASGAAILFITHDLAAAAQIADRVAVLREGRLVDISPASSFAGMGEALSHPYTRALWQALPQHQFIEAVGWNDEA